MANQTTNKCVFGGQEELAALIKTVVCNHYGVAEDMIIHPTKKEPIVTARQTISYFIHLNTDLVLKRIGAITGRDHGTVLWSCDVIEDRMETYPAFKQDIKDIERKIKMAIFNDNIACLQE